jgi:hypothetical protein
MATNTRAVRAEHTHSYSLRHSLYNYHAYIIYNQNNYLYIICDVSFKGHKSLYSILLTLTKTIVIRIRRYCFTESNGGIFIFIACTEPKI